MSDSPEAAALSWTNAAFTFKAGELDTETLKVLGFTGSEAISELFRFSVELCSDEPNIDAATVVGKPCILRLEGPSGRRYVNGIVRRFERLGEGATVVYYSAEIVPSHWLLTQRHKCRAYQTQNCSDMTVPGIIKQVLTDAGLPDDTFRMAIQETYETLEFVVQYHESDMDFISRLMEREGIFYFFEHTADGHKMVFGDSGVAHVSNVLGSEFPFHAVSGLVPDSDQETVFSVRVRNDIRMGSACVDDFDFMNPPLQLRASAAADSETSLEFSDYPGEYSEKTTGSRYATVRLEEFQATKRVFEIASTARGLLAGCKFSLTEHPIQDFNTDYLITHITHFARQPQSAEGSAGGEEGFRYQVDLTAIASDVSFRPTRKTRRPVVRGSQTALVVGPKGEEIYTDKYGRVKVQFHWDREGVYDENSSCWIRVSQGAAGGGYGMMFLPRVGQEVIVDFLEGNPDRPIITGRVYNNDQMPPYTLPDEKTKSVIKTNSSTGGGGTNEICFEDLKDSEKLLIYAQKDFHLRALNDRVENIGNDRHLTVEQHKFELIKQKKNIEVKLDQNEKIGGKYSLKVEGDFGVEVGGNYSVKVGGKLYLKSDQEVVIEAAKGLTLKCGGNFVKIDSSGVTILGTKVKVNSGGAAGSGTPVSLSAPEATIESEEATPGADVTYNADALAFAAAAVESLADTEQPEEPVPVELSWVEIEMIDEEGQPMPNELYEITYPDGKTRRAKLNEQGIAHIGLREPMDVQVTFPHLDQDAWERIE